MNRSRCSIRSAKSAPAPSRGARSIACHGAVHDLRASLRTGYGPATIARRVAYDQTIENTNISSADTYPAAASELPIRGRIQVQWHGSCYILLDDAVLYSGVGSVGGNSPSRTRHILSDDAVPYRWTTLRAIECTAIFRSQIPFCYSESLDDGIRILIRVEMEPAAVFRLNQLDRTRSCASTVTLCIPTAALDDTEFRACLALDGDSLACKIDVAVSIARVGAGGDEDYVAIDARIDGRLGRRIILRPIVGHAKRPGDASGARYQKKCPDHCGKACDRLRFHTPLPSMNG